MSQTRQLAAIMFTDMVGYSSLMGTDQQQALELLKKNRKLQKLHIDQHNGTWLKEMGDGILASFSSVSDAVFCAISIQESCKNVPELSLRIGIHQGEVVVENGDVFGDGVNIAARIEPLAPAGAVYVSSAVYQNILNRKEFKVKYVSEFKLKNIDYPLEVYQVDILDSEFLPGKNVKTDQNPLGRKSQWAKPATFGAVILLLILSVWWVRKLGIGSSNPPETEIATQRTSSSQELLALPKGPRIAVLKFTNLSNDPTQDYFTDGLTEDVITALSQTDLFVLASATSFQLDLEAPEIDETLERLKVRYLLRGSVRRQQNNIRVTAQLIDVVTNGQIWASNYDRDLTTSDIFSLQDDITERVVSTISDSDGIIYRANLQRLTRKLPDAINAYECVLRSYRFAQSHTPEDHLVARDCLEEAVRLDSSYVDALAQLAYLYREEYQHNFNQRPNALIRARNLAMNAVALDPRNQQAYYALALAYFGLDDVENFFLSSNQAIYLNPNKSNIIGGLGIHIGLAGDWERGIELLEKSMVLNPNSSLKPWLHLARSSRHCLSGNFSEALNEISQVSFSDVMLFDIVTIAILVQVNQDEEAVAKLKEELSKDPNFLENAGPVLDKFYLKDQGLIDLFMNNLHKISTPLK